MNFTIRHVREDDLKDLLAIRANRERWQKHFDWVKHRRVHFLVAEVDEHVVGFGLLKVATGGRNLPKLSDLFVLPGYRKGGIGKALIREREEIAKKLGYNKIYASVDPMENPQMTAMIKMLGFKAISSPYETSAEFVDAHGNAYTKIYMRIDYVKTLG